MFKRIYIEITNQCNLHCSFCHVSRRKKKVMSLREFEHIIKEVAQVTSVVYLHVLGEPLLHPELDEILTLCDNYFLTVNLTTNGTLLSKAVPILNHHKNIGHINLSLHSENEKEHYEEEIFESVERLQHHPTIIYRFWTMQDGILNKKSTEIVDKIISYYHLSTEEVEKMKRQKNYKLLENLYIDKQDQFEWPSLENKYQERTGFCYGLKSHLAILVDGTVVPCCLDGEGVIFLGNIFETPLQEILSSKRAKEIRLGFQRREAFEELCKHCSYKSRF